MADPNSFFNMRSNQLKATKKFATVMVYGSTPACVIKSGVTELASATLDATGKVSLVLNNGGNRNMIVTAITPIMIGTTFIHSAILGVQAVHSVLCTAENTNTTLHNKGFVLPYFNYSTGKPALVGFWFDISAALTTPPLLTDPNGNQADVYSEITTVAASDANTVVATAVEVAIEAFASASVDVFTSSVSSATITVTDNRYGQRTNKLNGATAGESTTIAAGAGTSGFTVSTTTAGHDGAGNSDCKVAFFDTSHNLVNPQAFQVEITVFPEPREQ